MVKMNVWAIYLPPVTRTRFFPWPSGKDIQNFSHDKHGPYGVKTAKVEHKNASHQMLSQHRSCPSRISSDSQGGYSGNKWASSVQNVAMSDSESSIFVLKLATRLLVWRHWSFRFPRLCLHTASRCWYPWADNYKRPLHFLESPWRTSAAGWRRSIVKQAVKICKARGFCRDTLGQAACCVHYTVARARLHDMGFRRFGNEKVWNGHTGRPLTNNIFVGPVWPPCADLFFFVVSLSCSFTKHKAHIWVSAEVQRKIHNSW